MYFLLKFSQPHPSKRGNSKRPSWDSDPCVSDCEPMLLHGITMQALGFREGFRQAGRLEMDFERWGGLRR